MNEKRLTDKKWVKSIKKEVQTVYNFIIAILFDMSINTRRN